MNIAIKILRFAWKNKTWIVPAINEGYKMVKRWRKINKLKRANINKEL